MATGSGGGGCGQAKGLRLLTGIPPGMVVGADGLAFAVDGVVLTTGAGAWLAGEPEELWWISLV